LCYKKLYVGFVKNGKENQNTDDKKRSYKDSDEEKEEIIKPKRRRLIIPDVDSDEDSGDEFKPGLLITQAIIFLSYCNFKLKK